MKKLIVILCLALVAGCASAPLTEEELYEREDKRIQRADDWRVCELIYKQSNLPTWHINHQHDRHDKRKSASRRAWEIRSDLIHNGCAQILRQLERQQR